MSERFENIRTEKLEEMINERQQFLEKVMAFVAEITREIGEEKEFHEESSYCSWRRELKSFGNFSFRHRSSWGIDESSVWYHPNIEEIELNKTMPVVRVDARDDKKKCKVEVFIEDTLWQGALLKMIEHKEELLTQWKKSKEERQKQLSTQTAEERKRAELLKEAERLKL